MVTLKEAKDFCRIDGCDEDALIASLLTTAKVLVEDVLRAPIDEEKEMPEPIRQAILILVGTLYEERQVSKNPKSGVSIMDALDMVRRMLFSYRKESF